jgi:hypothetical protein
MICKSCRKANQVLNARDGEEHVREARHLHDSLHCPGGTWCDCQHVIRYSGVVTCPAP